MVDWKALEDALKAEGLEVQFEVDPPGPMVSCVFRSPTGESTQFVAVFSDENGEYFSIMAPFGPLKAPMTLDDFPSGVLADLTRLSAFTRLSKLDAFESVETGKLYLSAVSECSTIAYTGWKLHRRMQACVDLALRAKTVLREYLA